MKIAMFSEKTHTESKTGWFRGGLDIKYATNDYRKNPFAAAGEVPKHYSTLTFSYEFPFDSDTISMAFAQPYTYSELQSYLCSLEKKCKWIVREPLCCTILGNTCDLLTITSPGKGKSTKRGVVLTARVHPGETVGSWMVKGAIDFLLSEDAEARALRDEFVFKIIPMLNPDGVIQGNYRASMSGCDLNRKYLCPSKCFHPTIFHAKKMAKEFSRACPLSLYCDFHGHSKQMNVFMYGNTDEETPEQYRLFPYIMSRVNEDFSFKASKFSVQRSKASTARVAMWKELGTPAVYTMEASFFGPAAWRTEPHFSVCELADVGKSLCQALRVYSKMQESPELPIKIKEAHDNEQKGESKGRNEILKAKSDDDPNKRDPLKELTMKIFDEIRANKSVLFGNLECER